MIPQNEGALDRVARVVVAIALGIVTFTALSGVWQIIAGIVAAILLVTGVAGFCPLYALVRFSTLRSRTDHLHPATKG